MWLRLFEAWLTARLLASPTFHRAVEGLHKRVREVRHGKNPADMGGTSIDRPGGSKGYLDYYIEEFKDQLRGQSRKK